MELFDGGTDSDATPMVARWADRDGEAAIAGNRGQQCEVRALQGITDGREREQGTRPTAAEASGPEPDTREGRKATPEVGDRVAQKLVLFGGHVAKGPPVVRDLRDDVQYVRDNVLNQLQFDAPAPGAEMSEAIAKLVQPLERFLLRRRYRNDSAAAGFDALRFRPEPLEKLRRACDTVARRAVVRVPEPSGGHAELADALVDVVKLPASITVVPLAPLPNTGRGQRSDPGSPGQVTDHGTLKRAVKRENYPFPGAARALGGDEAKGAVLQGRQHVVPFVSVQIFDHPERALGSGTCLVHHRCDGCDFG